MSLVFRDAIDAVLGDPSFSLSAAFTAKPGSTTINCRTILPRRDPEIRVGRGSGALAPAWKGMLKQAEIIARPKQGDILAILEDHWAGIYIVHSTREDSFAETWEVALGAPAVFPSPPEPSGGGGGGGGGGSSLTPRFGVPLTILDATHVSFPEVPVAGSMLIFVNTTPLRPVPGAPGLNESRYTGAGHATLGPGSLDPGSDAVWAIYFV